MIITRVAHVYIVSNFLLSFNQFIIIAGSDTGFFTNRERDEFKFNPGVVFTQNCSELML